MAALEILALNEATPQIRAPGTGDTYSAPRALALTPETLTGSAATVGFNLTQTWNTSGTPTAIKANITDTASNASSLLLDLQVGGSSKFNVSKSGNIATAGTDHNFTGAYVNFNLSGVNKFGIGGSDNTSYQNLQLSASRYLQFTEGSAATGSANTARVFCQDNGAGKTQLMVIFGSGVAQQIAIEP